MQVISILSENSQIKRRKREIEVILSRGGTS
jgi:hypothetical protein